jgi:membrane associated rhomboid family serine protease
MVWGLLPFDFEVSFESHITGALTGIVLAVIYRDQGPEPERSSLDDEEDLDESDPGPIFPEQGV